MRLATMTSPAANTASRQMRAGLADLILATYHSVRIRLNGPMRVPVSNRTMLPAKYKVTTAYRSFLRVSNDEDQQQQRAGQAAP